MLNFRQISSTMDTTWNIPASSLLYISWSLECPGEVQVVAMQCLVYSDPSIFSAAVLQFSLQDPSLTAIADPYLRVDAMWPSEDLLDLRVGLYREVVGIYIWALPGGYVQVYLTVFWMISSTFGEWLSSGVSCISSYYLSMNRLLLDITLLGICGG